MYDKSVDNMTNDEFKELQQDILLSKLEKDVELMNMKISVMSDRILEVEQNDLIGEYNVSRIAAWGSFALAGFGTLFFIMAIMTVVSAVA